MLVEQLRWPQRSAAFALAALEARGPATGGTKNEIDVGVLRRAAREALESVEARKLVRRAHAILRAYQRALEVRVAIERIDVKDLRADRLTPEVLRTLNSQWGPGPWTDEEERPGRPCECAKPWPFCPDCGTFIRANSQHVCKAEPVAVPLDRPHRHCGACDVPAPEPTESLWCVQVPLRGDIVTVAVTGSWLVGPVARVDPISTRREVFGWACSVHRSEASAQVPPADDARRITLVQGSPGRVATRRRRVTLDEDRTSAPVSDDAPRPATMEDLSLDEAIELAWASRRRKRALVQSAPPHRKD